MIKKSVLNTLFCHKIARTAVFVWGVLLTGTLTAQEIQYEHYDGFKIPFTVDEEAKTRSYFSEDCTEDQIRSGECAPLRVYDSETAEEIPREDAPTPAPEATPAPVTTQVPAPSPPPRPFEKDQTTTEAQTPCHTPECVAARQKENDAKKQMTQICLQALPQHCQGIPEEYTVCHPSQSTWDTNTIGCAMGLVEGLGDVGAFVTSIGKGLYGWFTSSQYREEATNTISFLYEDLEEAGWDGITEIFKSALVTGYDKFTQCLNVEGRYEYFCEAGIEIYAGYKIARIIGGPRKNWRRLKAAGRGVRRGAGVVGRGAGAIGRGAGAVGRGVGSRMRVMGDRISIVASMGRGVGAAALTATQKVAQKKALREMLGKKGFIDSKDLSGYQLGLLKNSQIRNRVIFSNLADDQAMHLSRNQLQRIPLLEVEKMSSANLGRTLSRMSDKQFQALMNKPDNVKNIPLQALQANLHRVTPVHIPNIPAESFTKVLPATFGRRMTAAKLKALTADQAKAVANGPQYHALNRTQRYIVDMAANGKTASIPTGRLARYNAAYSHDQLKRQSQAAAAAAGKTPPPSAAGGPVAPAAGSSGAGRGFFGWGQRGGTPGSGGGQQALKQKGTQAGAKNRKARRADQKQSRRNNRGK